MAWLIGQKIKKCCWGGNVWILTVVFFVAILNLLALHYINFFWQFLGQRLYFSLYSDLRHILCDIYHVTVLLFVECVCLGRCRFFVECGGTRVYYCIDY